MSGKFSIFLSLLMIFLVSMCTSQNTGNSGYGDSIKVTIDAPSEIFVNREFTVNLEIENRDNVTFDNVIMSFFNTGSFEKLSSCSLGPFSLEPEKVQVMSCRLRYSGDIVGKTSERIDASIKYVKNFSTSVNFQVLSQSEYEKIKIMGTFKNISNEFTNSNSELSLETELSENPVIKDGQEKYIHFTLKNHGSSLIDSVSRNDIEIRSVPEGIIMKSECDIPNILFQDSGVFSRISCQISTYYAQEDYTNTFAFFDLTYSQESRTFATIKIMT